MASISTRPSADRPSTPGDRASRRVGRAGGRVGAATHQLETAPEPCRRRPGRLRVGRPDDEEPARSDHVGRLLHEPGQRPRPASPTGLRDDGGQARRGGLHDGIDERRRAGGPAFEQAETCRVRQPHRLRPVARLGALAGLAHARGGRRLGVGDERRCPRPGACDDRLRFRLGRRLDDPDDLLDAHVTGRGSSPR